MYYKIDEDLARRAKEMVSMTDYEPGSATRGYRESVDAAAHVNEAQKKQVSPYYHDKLDALLDLYARRLAEWTNDYNRNQAKYPSQFICGAGGFDMKKHNKQMQREDALWREYDEIAAILNKIKAVGTGPVDLADPHAREILADRLKRLEDRLETGKAMNAHYRKKGTMQGFRDFSDEYAASWDRSLEDAPAFAKAPFPGYELSSLRGKIKRVKERLAELDKREAQADQPAEDTAFDGGKIVRNLELDRLQIIFDERPDDDVRASLKTNGFRWSPRNNAWQRQLTRPAEIAARKALGLAD